MKKKIEKLTEEEILQQINEMSAKASKNNTIQTDLFNGIDIGEEDLDTSFNPEILLDTADPDQSHRLYYTMRSTMMRNLPKGQENLSLRKWIYDEKSLFLNRGKKKNESGTKGSDERMSYIGNFLKVAFDIVNNWVIEGANPINLYNAFNDLNKSRGYK